MYRLRDYTSKQVVQSDNLIFTGKHGPWEVEMNVQELRKKISQPDFASCPPSLKKYLPFLPLQGFSDILSLQDGPTPLIEGKNTSKEHDAKIFFKVESKSLTGSFKDRGSAVEIAVAKEKNAQALAVASTGNMAASCACYAAAAEIPCFVFVPEDVPPAKLAQVIAYGGRIVQVRGSYNDAARLAYEACERLGFYLAGDYAFRIEGAKTAAFEIFDQLGGKAPDIVIIPMGCGTNLASYWKGFCELRELGLLEDLPKLVGVQAAGASPIVHAVQQGARQVTALSTSARTLASSIAVSDPLDGQKALDAIRASGGRAYAFEDLDMLRAQYELSSSEGLFSELSGAASFLALNKLQQEGIELEGKSIVCVLCGDGLKDPSSVLRVALKPVNIQPAIEEFEELYRSEFFSGRPVSFFPKERVLFESIPTESNLEHVLLDYLDMRFKKELLSKIRHAIGKFLLKGKTITFADLQDIVQDQLSGNADALEPVLEIVDFDIRTGQDVRPSARVIVKVHGHTCRAEALGAGPVDAVLQALRKACGEEDCELTSYTAHIRSQGTDAVVQVEMKLRTGGQVVVGRSASPDVIQASLEAFVEAFNASRNKALPEQEKGRIKNFGEIRV